MNYEELSFFNQQLAGMLKSGLPLEGSLRQIATGMQSGPLRTEIEQLERDLAQGVPVEEAFARRQLPEMYKVLVRVGIKSNDLPGVLIMMADYYRTVDSTWTRLKGLLVYPAIVLGTSLIVSALLAFLCMFVSSETLKEMGGMLPGRPRLLGSALLVQAWLPVVLLAFVSAALIGMVSVRRIRHALRWRLPAFREASLAQLASALSMMIANGCDANTAFQLVEKSEPDAAARGELRSWRERLAGGAARFADVARGTIVPPLFVWLVTSAGENWATGFRRAAEVYGARANHRIELALYAALPVSILLLAAIVVTEIAPLFAIFIQFMNMLGDMGGD